MSRDSSGNYTLPAGNPVVSGTTISSSVQNSTLSDIATALTGSLARDGAGGMTGQFKAASGTVGAPGITFSAELGTGFYRIGTGSWGFSLSGTLLFDIDSGGMTFASGGIVLDTGSLTVTAGTITGNGSGLTTLNASNISSGTLADARLSANVVLENILNTFTAQQVITNTTGTSLTINSPTSGALLCQSAGAVFGRYTNTAVTATLYMGADVGSNGGFIGTETNHQFSLYSNAAVRARINATGGLSILAPTSGTALDIVGTAAGDPQVAFAGAGAYVAPAVNKGILHYDTAGGTLTLAARSSAGSTSLGFRVSNGGAERTPLTISNVGGVTIATPASGTALTVNGVAAGQQMVVTDGTVSVRLTYTAANAFFGPTTSHGLFLQTVGNDRLGISNAGNITFNAPTSGQTLTVNGLAAGTLAGMTDGTVSLNINTASTRLNFGTTSNHDVFIATNGTGRVNIGANGNTVFSGSASTTPVTVTFSATAMTVDCRLSNVFRTTFTANVTTAPTISNPQDGQTINWRITQDATGGRTMTWPTSFKWPNATPGVLSTAANAVDIVTATYDSATGFWYATLLKAFG